MLLVLQLLDALVQHVWLDLSRIARVLGELTKIVLLYLLLEILAICLLSRQLYLWHCLHGI